MKKLKVIVEFTFETDKDIERAKKSIEEVIYSDMNYYFQYGDDITDFTEVDIKEITEVE